MSFRTLSCFVVCGFTAGCLNETPAPDDLRGDELLADPGMRIPVDFDDACAALRDTDAAPPGLTVSDFFACLTDDSHAALDALYRVEARRIGRGAPATLDELVARHGDVELAGVSLRALAFGTTDSAEMGDAGFDAGIAPTVAPRFKFPAQYGFDPTKCGDASCLSAYVDVVGGRRKLGFFAAQRGATAVKDDDRKRFLDQIDPGVFPDFRQSNLADQELQAAGCGPVSSINLFEWWGIPVYNGASELATFDARASFIAGRMSTLSGFNFTDDDDLIDFVINYPAALQSAGKIPGRPAYHYMRGNPEGWKVMLSYVARGYPVITLYSTSDSSLHWALVTGMKGGKLLIANAGDRTIADFYNQWQDWEDLSWYASAGADLYVETATFVAYTGWGSSTPQPSRFATRTSGASLPSYTSGSKTYAFRYCLGANDELGNEAESVLVGAWTSEPTYVAPGYCMFQHGATALTLAPRPSGGKATAARNTNLTLTVDNTPLLSGFVANNPGVRCLWYGLEGTTWKKLSDRLCSAAGALSYTFANAGAYSRITFQVHSAELARTTWTITTP